MASTSKTQSFLMIGYQRIKKFVQSLVSRSPLTRQSCITLAMCGYLLFFLGQLESDIVATALTYGLCFIIIVITAYTTLYGLIIKTRISPSIGIPSEQVRAKESFTAVLSGLTLSSMPGLLHEFSLIFEQQGAENTTIRLLTKTDHTKIPLTITLPHRGNWRINGIRCSIRDVTGFCAITWTVPIEKTCCVTPKQQLLPAYPIVSSSQRAGDSAPDIRRRVGDPYDLKQYHPSDGVKKIVWKVFAKTGELISRHPEPCMTPEGFVGLYVAARQEDDGICAIALEYIKSLEKLGIDFCVACDGLCDLPIALDVSSSRDLLIDTVWNCSRQTNSKADLQRLLDACSEYTTTGTIETLVLFISGDRLEDSDEAAAMNAIGSWLEQKGIRPVFLLTEPSTTPFADSSKPVILEQLHLITKQESPLHATGEYQRFLNTCLSKGWEVHV